MKKFKSKSIDLTLVIEGSSGEEKTYLPKEKATAAFSRKTVELANKFIEAEESKDKEAKMSPLDIYLKQLSFVYDDLDEEWLILNQTVGEIRDMVTIVFEELTGIKKGSKS